MTHHQLHTLIRAVVFAALLVTASGCALPGWLLPLQDGVARFTWRIFGCAALAGAFLWLAFDVAWYLTIVNIVLGAHMLSRAGYWWKQVEQARKIRRITGDWNKAGGRLTVTPEFEQWMRDHRSAP